MPETKPLHSPSLIEPKGSQDLYFRLVVRGLGYDPKAFKWWKFVKRGGQGLKVAVFGRGSGAVYEADESDTWTSLFAEDLRGGRFSAERPPALDRQRAVVLQQVLAAFEASGLTGGLQLLNDRVPHRFSAVYRVAHGVMRNVALVDKERSLDTFALEAVPLTDSFCQFALKDGFFITNQSGSDARLVDHPYSGKVGCYVGVPLSVADQKLYGTICHFDFTPQRIDQEEFFLLQHVALKLPRGLLQSDRVGPATRAQLGDETTAG